MASTSNAFASLMGAGETVSSGKKKTKAKNKSRSATNQAETKAAPASAPATTETKSAAPEVASMLDAAAKLELAARTAVSSGDRAKLLRDWCRQAAEGPNAQAYQDASGSRVSFKHVLLNSKALDITAELAISHPLNHQHEDQLERLFSTFLPVDGRQSSYLAGAITKLAQLLVDGAPDSVGAAQRAVVNAIKHFKHSSTATANGSGSSDSASAWLQRLKKLESLISSELTILQKLTQASGVAVTKERVQCALSILKLQEGRVELLLPASIPSVQAGAGSGNPAVAALQELHSVVLNHAKEAEALEASARSHTAYAEAQFASSHAAMQREELLLSKQAAELAGQISTLEAQLQAVRLQAAEVDQRRALLKKQGKPAASNGSAAAKAQPRKSAADYKQQLSVVDDLLDLVDPHRHTAVSAEQIWEAQAGQGVAVGEYVSFARQCLDMNLSLLAETPQKINFSKQRISQAEKLLALTAGNAKNQDVNKKQKEDAEKLLAETMKTAESVIVQSEGITKNVSSRHRALASIDPAGAASLAQEVSQVEDLYSRIGRQYTNVMMCYDQAPLKVTPAPRPARSNVQRRGEAGATPSASDTPVPAVAKAAPAAAAPAAPTPAPATPVVKPAPALSTTSTRSWNKPQQAAAAAEEDSSLPTPAEAFRGPETSDGFHTVAGGRRNRNKA